MNSKNDLALHPQMNEFRYKDWTLFEAIDALKAYDDGALDSGVGDEDLRRAVRDYLTALPDEARKLIVARYARQFLTDDSLRIGYGLDDVFEFTNWLTEMGVGI